MFKEKGPAEGYSAKYDPGSSANDEKTEKAKYNPDIKLNNQPKSNNPVRATQADKAKDASANNLLDVPKAGQPKNRLEKIDKLGSESSNANKLSDKYPDSKKMASKYNQIAEKTNEKDNNGGEVIDEEIKGFEDIDLDEEIQDSQKKSTEKLKDSFAQLKKSTNALYTSSEDPYGAS